MSDIVSVPVWPPFTSGGADVWLLGGGEASRFRVYSTVARGGGEGGWGEGEGEWRVFVASGEMERPAAG